MSQGEQWAAQEFAKHITRDSRQARLQSELAFQALVADLPRPASISERKWAQSAKGHMLLIKRLQSALATA